MTRWTARIVFLLIAFIATSLVIACGGGSNNGGSGTIAGTSPTPGTPPSGTSGSGGSGTTSGSGTTTGSTGTTSGGTGTTTSGTGTTTGGTTGQPSQPPQTNAVETIYMASYSSGNVNTVGYNIDPGSGHLKKIGPFPTGHMGLPAYTSNPQQRVYVTNSGASQCNRGYCTMDTHFSTVVRDTSTGAVKIGMDDVVFPKRFVGIEVLANGKFAYTVDWQSPEGTDPMIRGFRIDQETGVLKQIDIGNVPFGMWGPLFVHPQLPLLYAFEDRCCSTAPVTKLHIWSADENTGRLTETAYSPAILSGPFQYPPAISDDGAYFYAAKPPTVYSELDVLRMDARGVPESQALASASTEQFPAFEDFLVHPSGTIAYGWGIHQNPPNEVRTVMHAYRLDAATNKFIDLDLSAKMPPTAMSPLGIDKSGKHFYMGTSLGSPILLYNVHPVTGDLTLVGDEASN